MVHILESHSKRAGSLKLKPYKPGGGAYAPLSASHGKTECDPERGEALLRLKSDK